MRWLRRLQIWPVVVHNRGARTSGPMKTYLPQINAQVRAYLPQVLAGVSACCLLSAMPHALHASSKEAQTAGAAVFREKGCQHCHGADLTGTDRGPNLSTVGKKRRKDQIDRQIREGAGGMPAFGDVLQPDEIKSLVDFLTARRKAARKGEVPPSAKPPSAVRTSSDDSGI